MSENAEKRCRTRIMTRAGTAYMIFETLDQLYPLLGNQGSLVTVTTWGGSELMPPERMTIRVDEVASLQEMSLEGWIWSKHATELHYARQLREMDNSPMEIIAAAQARLAETLDRGT